VAALFHEQLANAPVRVLKLLDELDFADDAPVEMNDELENADLKRKVGLIN
jgi:hypothetical protein